MNMKQSLEQQINQRRSVVLVVNTRSRRGERIYFAALDGLARRGISVSASYPVHDPARLPETIAHAVESGGPMVIVGGGDGTISSAVDCFAHRDVVLGILPLGTGNSFARTLGIPLTLEGALDVIASGKVVDVDLGQVGNDYFANVTSIGLTADVARLTPGRLKRFLGVASYALIGIPVFLKHRPFLCRLSIGGRVEVIRTHQVTIANGSFFGVTRLTPEAHVDDRELIVLVMRAASPWRMLRAWVHVLLHDGRADPADARYLTTAELTIETDPPQYIDVDGESTLRTPAHFRVAANALRVMAPRSFVDT